MLGWVLLRSVFRTAVLDRCAVRRDPDVGTYGFYWFCEFYVSDQNKTWKVARAEWKPKTTSRWGVRPAGYDPTAGSGGVVAAGRA
jgi:hypothetical protein